MLVRPLTNFNTFLEYIVPNCPNNNYFVDYEQ